MARTKTAPVPEVGSEAPEFHLPSAQGGQLRLSMRTARGPVVVVFYGPFEEDVAYFEDLAAKEDEINMAAASVVGIGRGEPEEAREFVRKTGIKSYVLYDYAGTATREYGLLEKDKEHGEHARPATFVIDSDHKVVHAWTGERPKADEILAKVSEITGLPKPVEEAGEGEAGEEKPRKRKAVGKTDDGMASGESETAGKDEDGEAGERKKLSQEEREKRRAERRSARDAGEKPAAAVAEKEAGREAAEEPEAGAGQTQPANEPGDEAGDEGSREGDPGGERAKEE